MSGPFHAFDNGGMAEYRHSAHAVFDLNYHLIWCPKYRYKILRGRVAEHAHFRFGFESTRFQSPLNRRARGPHTPRRPGIRRGHRRTKAGPKSRPSQLLCLAIPPVERQTRTSAEKPEFICCECSGRLPADLNRRAYRWKILCRACLADVMSQEIRTFGLIEYLVTRPCVLERLNPQFRSCTPPKS